MEPAFDEFHVGEATLAWVRDIGLTKKPPNRLIEQQLERRAYRSSVAFGKLISVGRPHLDGVEQNGDGEIDLEPSLWVVDLDLGFQFLGDVASEGAKNVLDHNLVELGIHRWRYGNRSVYRVGA